MLLLARLAHVIVRRRRAVIGAWVLLTLFGAFSAGQVSKRWFQSFSIPGKSAYEANQRTLNTFGTGIRPPNVVVFRTSGDATKSDAIRTAMERAAAARDPPLRLRHAARGADPDRGRSRRDPEHVHARLGADVHHERLDHRR